MNKMIMQINKKILLSIFLFAAIIEAHSQTPRLVFFDDFSKPATTETKFSFYNPNNTNGSITAHTVTNNYLELRMDVTDANSWAVVNYDFASANKIIIVCDLYYHEATSNTYNNSTDFYMPSINFSNYSTTSYKVTDAIIQAKMQTDQYSPDNPCGDNIHPSLQYSSIALPQSYCTQNFRRMNSFASATSASFYDKWLNGAIITLDKTTGYISVDIDGDGLNDMDGYMPTALAGQVNTISFSPYGWWTGHIMRVRNLKIYTANTKTYSTINKSICEGQNYLGYTTSGTYKDTLVNVAGFDSVRTLNLTVIPKTYSTINQSICESNNFFGHTVSGKYIDTLVNVAGCDSIRTLNLVVNPKTYSTLNQRICEGQSYLGYTASGTYIDTLLNVAGCDSIRTLNLFVIPKTHSTINQTICEGQNYLGHTTSGIYIDTILNKAGCDSVRTLNLTILPRTYSSIYQTICEGQSYLGYTLSGTYVDTILNKAGCDSVRTLNLTVNPKPFVFAGNDTSLVAGNSIVLIGSSVSNNLISLQWTPNYAIDNTTLLNPSVSPLNTTVYILTATNSLGCTASDSMKVTVIPKYDVLVPNAFTPNYDGRNDVFKPTFFYVPIKYKMIIYNRNGQLIFQTEDYTKGWNGKINGVPQNNGTYVWMMIYSLQNNVEETKRGTVVLIR